MNSVWQFFTVAIIIQLFFGSAVTLIVHFSPTEPKYIATYDEAARTINAKDIGGQIEGSINQQMNIPVVDLGALVYYSGNLILDLIVNSAYAFPEMIGLLIRGVTEIFNIDTFAVTIIEGFASVAMTALYMVGVLQLITSIRARGNVV